MKKKMFGSKKTLTPLIVLFALMMPGGCNSKDPQNSEHKYIWTDEQIPRAFFKSDWKFFKGGDGPLGSPIEAFLKLVVVKGAEEKILRLTTSLKGYVEIKSLDEALLFVRLFTDLDTHYLFDDAGYIEVRPTSNKPSWGELPVKEFKKLGLKEPLVMKDGDCFVVVRYVAIYGGHIFQIQERVSASGDYEITKETLIAEEVNISTPIYY